MAIVPMPVDNPKSIKQKLEMIRNELEQEKQSFLPHWKELNNFFKPRRARFNSTDRNRGDRRTSQLIDSTATFAVRTASAGMHSGVTSPAREWFRLTITDPDKAELDSVKLWLYDVAKRMHSVLLRSNIYNSFPQMYSDLLIYGTSPMILEEDEEDVIRTYVFPIGSYSIANDSRNVVRTFVREFSMTVNQIVERFGIKDGRIDWSNISDYVREMYTKHQRQQWIEVVHIIQPNWQWDRNMYESEYKKFISCYYEKGTDNRPLQNNDRFLEKTGYDEFPVMCARWELSGEDVYSTDCPGMTILGDVKQLQKGELKSLKAIDKSIDPPMVAPTSMMTSKTSILPGDVSYVDDREGGFRAAHEVKLNIQDLEYKQEQVRARINKGMYVDLFMMIQQMDAQRRTQRDITAREIEERHEEKLLALGPVLENLNQGVYDPTITRVFNIMNRRGMLPPPPPELEGEPLRVEYISMMWQAQKAIGLGGIDRFSNFVVTIYERTQNSAVLEPVNWMDMVEEYADRTGLPPSSLYTEEQVAAIRQKREEAQQAAQDAATMKEAAIGAKTLSETDTSKPSALKQVAAMAGQGGTA